MTEPAYEISLNDEIIICDIGSGSITLPSATVFPGRSIEIVNRSAATVTIGAVSGQLIETAQTTTIVNGSNYRLYSTGVKWLMLV